MRKENKEEEEEKKQRRKKKKEKKGERTEKRESALKQPGAKGSFCAKIEATNGLTPLTNRFRPKWHPNT